MPLPQPYPDPTMPRRAVLVADPMAARAALTEGAQALVLADPLPPGLAEALRTRRPGLGIYAALERPDDPALDGFTASVLDGVILRDARSGRDVAALGARLAVREAEVDLADGHLSILAAIAHPLGLLDLRSFAGASPRLAGLGLDEPALAAVLGAGEALARARATIRLAAAAAGVVAFAIVAAGPGDRIEDAEAARWDGFGLVVA